MSESSGATGRQEQERSRVTRQRLMEAAIGALRELGWAGATMTVIAERAGVSRGACQHHFPTRADLVAAAVEYVGSQQMEEVLRRSAQLPADERRTEAILHMLAGIYTSPLFISAVQLWVAAAADPELRTQLTPLEARTGREVHRLTVKLLDVDDKDPEVRELVQATLDLIRGLALANLLHDDSARRKKVLHRWARTLDAALKARRTPGSRRD
ncbi:TetR/AcrR family transcriptional regulator [Pyxidicoccus parkwayensis]|uniref:TetR/AcrR family transcriptional regulator n=1 Tax=Pyxidicoccus parkwayensis TaxID=2813578 RepID=A0ABX7NZ56_9BACT|nr:TetR/AcrR family transcriptional regulator [Pyxidicoccus parkwaysis]QSQ21353.1 TetR/AcrR family transcriptional regulator [Pyxidicoccus parkwaysis]